MSSYGACLTDKGDRNENQDFVLLKEQEDKTVLGIFDGHGSNGKSCAEKTKDFFSNYDFTADLETCFIEAHASFKENKSANFSGTTATTILVFESHLLVGNVGDSEAISIFANGRANTITVKHQLSDEDEKQRVINGGGRVERQRGKNGQPMDRGPFRVWLPDIQTPGLMVSRSIGDIMCHDIGVTATPSISRIERTADLVAVIIGSDGLWDFVTPEQASEFVAVFIEPETAAYGLVKLAHSQQTRLHSDNVSVVVYFLESKQAREERIQTDPQAKEKLEETMKKIKDFENKIELNSKTTILKTKDVDQPNTGSILFGNVTAAKVEAPQSPSKACIIL